MSPLQARVNLRPWPYAPRPFGDEAFGSWFGRVASRYRMTVEMAWEINGLGPLPALTSVGWILFSPLDESALEKVAALPGQALGGLSRRRDLLVALRAEVVRAPVRASAFTAPATAARLESAGADREGFHRSTRGP
jgi:hypothetical protein